MGHQPALVPSIHTRHQMVSSLLNRSFNFKTTACLEFAVFLLIFPSFPCDFIAGTFETSCVYTRGLQWNSFWKPLSTSKPPATALLLKPLVPTAEVLIISTDPAHSLGDALGCRLSVRDALSVGGFGGWKVLSLVGSRLECVCDIIYQQDTM